MILNCPRCRCDVEDDRNDFYLRGDRCAVCFTTPKGETDAEERVLIAICVATNLTIRALRLTLRQESVELKMNIGKGEVKGGSGGNAGANFITPLDALNRIQGLQTGPADSVLKWEPSKPPQRQAETLKTGWYTSVDQALGALDLVINSILVNRKHVMVLAPISITPRTNQALTVYYACVMVTYEKEAS